MNDDHNPYQVVSRIAAPVARAQQVEEDYESASYGRRLFNYLIDSFVFGIFKVVVVLAIGRASIGRDPLKDIFMTTAVMLIYYVVMEGLFGATIGKFVTGTRVVDEDGKPPGWGTVVVRTLGRCIPFEPFSIFFYGQARTAWHDKLANTRVIRIS
ncbi:RDD family protein [Pseudomonas sp. CGJS7]|uniref:RDD family protein n=1 Tax=Pseudomonas sp. CGJS7 TaxID=3109348 RepID=UPI00300BBD33